MFAFLWASFPIQPSDPTDPRSDHALNQSPAFLDLHLLVSFAFFPFSHDDTPPPTLQSCAAMSLSERSQSLDSHYDTSDETDSDLQEFPDVRLPLRLQAPGIRGCTRGHSRDLHSRYREQPKKEAVVGRGPFPANPHGSGGELKLAPTYSSDPGDDGGSG